MKAPLHVLCFIVFSLLVVHPSFQKPAVIIDTDVDIDDLWAIAYLVKSPYVDIKAITACGNAWSDSIYGVPNILHLINKLGCPQIPVAYGANFPQTMLNPTSSPNGIVPVNLRNPINNYFTSCLNESLDYSLMPSPIPASQLIIDIVHSSDIKVDILVLGSATNLAQALIMDPSIKENIGGVYFSGGKFDNTTIVPATFPYTTKTKGSSWNVFSDPLAMQRVFDSGLPIRMMSSQAQGELLVNISLAHTYAQRYNVNQFYVDFVTKAASCTSQTELDIYYWDPSTAAFYEQFTQTGSVNFCTNYLFINAIVDLVGDGGFGRTMYTWRNGTVVEVCQDADPNVFVPLFWERMSSLGLGDECSAQQGAYVVEDPPSTFDLQKTIDSLQAQVASLVQAVNVLSRNQNNYNSSCGCSHPPSHHDSNNDDDDGSRTDINFYFADMLNGAQ